MDRARRRLFVRLAGWLAAALIVGFVTIRLGRDLAELQRHPLAHTPRWDVVVLSGGVFLLAHAVLVQTWLSVLSCWDSRLPFWTAARIWSVSNLGKYLPGKVWQIGAMVAMAKEAGVSPLAATGSAILGALVNVMTGFVVVLLSGKDVVDHLPGRLGGLATGATAVACGALLLAPWLVPALAPQLARVTGRRFEATLPARAVIYAVVGNTGAWLLYGAAFEMFVRGMLGATTGGYSAYLTAYTFSYVVGYVFLFAPAGAGVREVTMLSTLQFAGLAAAPQAALVTVSSRIWLTLLEVTPGLVFWAQYRVRHRFPTTDPSDGPTS